MFKTIIVPLDGSLRAEAALVPATWIATKLDADVRLVTSSFAADIADDEAVLARARSQMPGVSVQTEVLRGQFPVHAIVNAVSSSPEPLLCMSTRGHSGIAEIVLGSVADEVLQNVSAPVVLVGPSFDLGAGEPRNMVVCVDSTPESAAVTTAAVDLAHDLGLDAEVVTVVDGHEPSAAADEARARAEQVRAAFEARDVNTAVGVRESSDIDGSLLTLVEALDARLVALVSHGRFGIAHRSLGDVGTEIVRRSTCPVLVQRVVEG